MVVLLMLNNFLNCPCSVTIEEYFSHSFFVCKFTDFNIFSLVQKFGRCVGLMVSALNSGASSLGSSPDQGHCVVFLGRTLYSHSASLTQVPVYKWVPANLMMGINLNPAMY